MRWLSSEKRVDAVMTCGQRLCVGEEHNPAQKQVTTGIRLKGRCATVMLRAHLPVVDRVVHVMGTHKPAIPAARGVIDSPTHYMEGLHIPITPVFQDFQDDCTFFNDVKISRFQDFKISRFGGCSVAHSMISSVSSHDPRFIVAIWGRMLVM